MSERKKGHREEGKLRVGERERNFKVLLKYNWIQIRKTVSMTSIRHLKG